MMLLKVKERSHTQNVEKNGFMSEQLLRGLISYEPPFMPGMTARFVQLIPRWLELQT